MRLSPRRALPAVVAPTLLASLAVAAPSSAASAPAAVAAQDSRRASAVTLTIEPLWSGTGERIALTGEVFDARTYRALTNRPIALQSRVRGTTRWSTLIRLESNQDGAFRHVRTADRSRDYRAVYSGNSWYKPKQSSWERQTTKSGAKTRVSAKLHAVSSGAQLRGRVTKLWSSSIRPLKGVSVYVQARRPYGTYWFDAGRTSTDSKGYYTWRTSVKKDQCFRYRAIYKGNSNGWAGKSITTHWTSCS